MKDERGLVELAASVADGDVLDWAALEAELNSDVERSVFRQLRVLAELAELHRSVADEPDPSPRAAPADLTDSAANAFPSLASTLAGSGEVVPAPEPSLGRWGPYELRRSKGLGTLGEVVLARDHLQRDVVIRFLPPNAQPAHTDALLRTGQLLASLRHPNVVQVYGTEEHDGRVGLVMECIDGRDLTEVVMSQGTLSAREAALIGWELCRAVAALHREGLVHGLLSPGNIVREAGGRLVLLDVWPQGLPVDSLSFNTATLPFIAPEVAAGAAPSVRSDIFSLGVALYFLVSGEPPLRASSLSDLVDQHRRGGRVPLADLRPDLPDDFIRIVERANDPDVERRYSSVSALKEALSRTLGWDTWARRRTSTASGGQVLAQTAGGVLQAPQEAPWSLGLLGVALSALVIGGTAAWVLLPRLMQTPAAPAAGAGVAGVAAAPRVADVRVALGVAPDADAELSRQVVEQLAQDLSTSPRFRVIAPVAVAHLQGRPVSAIMQTVEADVFLEVAAERRAGEVAAAVHVVRTGAAPLDVSEATSTPNRLRPFTSRLAQRVVTALTSADEPLQPSQRSQLPLENAEAMRAYIDGLAGLNRGGRFDVEAAADAFRRATVAEPSFVLAYARRAEALLSLYRHNALSAEEALPVARDVLAGALARDDRSAEAYAALGDLYAEQHDWVQAERHFQRSLALNPSGEYARIRYAMLLSGRGRVEEAVEQIRQASALNPSSSVLGGYFGATLHYARRFEEAAGMYERVLRLDAQYSAAYIGLCKAYTELQRTEDALKACRAVESQNVAEDPFVLSQLVKIHADAGNRREARRHLDALLRGFSGRPTGDGAFWVALAYVSLGQTDEALTWLDEAVALKSSRLAYARVDSRLDPLRGDPRFLTRMAHIEALTSAPVTDAASATR